MKNWWEIWKKSYASGSVKQYNHFGKQTNVICKNMHKS